MKNLSYFEYYSDMIKSGGFVPHCVRKFGGLFTKVGDSRNPTA